MKQMTREQTEVSHVIADFNKKTINLRDETQFACLIADRYFWIQEVTGGYDYSIMDMDYREIDGGIYDNPDVTIREALKDIVEDLVLTPDYNGAKGQITVESELIPLDFEEVFIKAEEANRIGSAVYSNRTVMEFKAKTENYFKPIDGLSATEIEELIEEYVTTKLAENDFDAHVRGVVISGSRCRGLEEKNSDLDIVVELSGNEREDDLFHLLHEDKFCIGGVTVDINPITREKTGTLATYLPEVENYLTEKKQVMKKEVEEVEPKKATNNRGNQMTKDFRNNIAQMFIRSLEEKQLSWKKNWSAIGLLPQNAVTGKNYKGINRFYLKFLCEQNGWKDPRFATFQQIKEKGWHLNKGAKGMKVEYWMPYDRELKKVISWDEADLSSEKHGLIAKYYTVFNAKDIEGIPPFKLPEKKDIQPDEILSTISKNMKIELINDGGDRAFYRPSEDKIHLPEPGYFESDYAYNSVAMHELAHATGAEHRLNRNIQNVFGSPNYAFEELVAEICSVFMSENLASCMETYEMDNHKAYVQGWIQAIKENPDILIHAIKEANKAADYLEEMAELTPEKTQKKEEILEVDEEKIISVPKKEQEYSEVKEKNQNPNEVRRKEIVKDLASHDFKPTKRLVHNILELDKSTGNKNTLSDIARLHKEKATLEENAKDILNQIVKECKGQEIAMEQCR